MCRRSLPLRALFLVLIAQAMLLENELPEALMVSARRLLKAKCGQLLIAVANPASLEQDWLVLVYG